MANRCYTDYTIVGEKKAVKNLYNAITKLLKDSTPPTVWLSDLAEHYDITDEHISTRGCIRDVWHFFTDSHYQYILSFTTDTAWCGCHDLFKAINKKLGGGLSINYREVEPGCEIFVIHDKDNFYPEKYCVSAGEGVFEDFGEQYFETVYEVIRCWCDAMGEKQEDRTDEEMLEYIEDYEYEGDEFFNIYEFTRE